VARLAPPRGGSVTSTLKWHNHSMLASMSASASTDTRRSRPIYVSGFGPQAAELAGRIGDGYCIAMPDAELVKTFRGAGGGDNPSQAGTKVSWDRAADAALDVAHRLRANEGLPGQLAQTLPRPKDFADAMTLVPRETVAESVACGPDADKHIAQVRKYLDADIDEVYLQRSDPTWTGSSQAGNATYCRSYGTERTRIRRLWTAVSPACGCRSTTHGRRWGTEGAPKSPDWPAGTASGWRSCGRSGNLRTRDRARSGGTPARRDGLGLRSDQSVTRSPSRSGRTPAPTSSS
jgi:hypothetical protein